MNLYEVTFEQVREAYKSRDLRPRDCCIRPDEQKRCCALGALVYLNNDEVGDLFEELDVPEDQFWAFVLGFDAGFSGRINKVRSLPDPAYPEPADLYLQAVSIGEKIAAWDAAGCP